MADLFPLTQEESLSPRCRVPAAMRVASTAASDGWPLRHFALDCPNPRGSVLFLGGRGDFFEKYLEAIEHWRERGWNVAGFDWRGQGGSGRLDAGGLCHLADFGTLVDDLADFAAQWQARSPGPHVAIAHSMGGHVLLRWASERRMRLDGLVLLAPMIGLRAGPLRGAALNRLALAGSLRWMRGRPSWTGAVSPMPGRITSCEVRHAEKLWWKAERPELARGAPTWGWVAAAARSMMRLERQLKQRPLDLSGLILASQRDPVIDLQAIRRALRYLPRCELTTIANAGHELLRESDGPRLETFHRIDRYLDGLG